MSSIFCTTNAKVCLLTALDVLLKQTDDVESKATRCEYFSNAQDLGIFNKKWKQHIEVIYGKIIKQKRSEIKNYTKTKNMCKTIQNRYVELKNTQFCSTTGAYYD